MKDGIGYFQYNIVRTADDLVPVVIACIAEYERICPGYFPGFYYAEVDYIIGDAWIQFAEKNSRP